MAKIRIAIFASGNGSNAVRLTDHFKEHPLFEVAFILTNRADAPVVGQAHARGVEALAFTNEQVEKGDFLLEVCTNQGVDAILLAGYLRKIPTELVAHYPKRILNIHPALLPDFGGKGMYGMHVHRAVLDSGKLRSGITIHYVDPNYDEGAVIAQFFAEVITGDTPETLAARIQALEHVYYPFVAEKTLQSLYHV